MDEGSPSGIGIVGVGRTTGPGVSGAFGGSGLSGEPEQLELVILPDLRAWKKQKQAVGLSNLSHVVEL